MKASLALSAFLRGAVLLAVSLALHPLAAQAQQVGIFPTQEAGKRVGQAQELVSYGPEIMGDAIGTYDGGLSFLHTDAAIPGNDFLPVSVGRKFSANAGRMPLERSERFTDTWMAYQGLFGDWEIDLPYLSGTYSSLQGWVVQTATPTARCSSPTSAGEMMPSSLMHQQAHFRASAIHSGITLNFPGGGGEPITLRNAGTPHPKPNDSAYRWHTKSNWALSCIPTLKHSAPYSGSGSRGGEGFLAIAPDGTKYHFDWMVEYAEKKVKQLVWTQTTGALGSYNASEAKLPRVEARIYPTRMEDRFGNWVNYTWSGKRLTAISSSDGRSISIAYNASNRISSITAAGGTTTYGYDSNGSLTSVTKADGSKWTFNFAALWTHPRYRAIQFNVEHLANYEERFMCAGGRLLNLDPVTLSMTAPSGASGSFVLNFRRHYRGAVDTCMNTGRAVNWLDWNGVPGNPTFEEIPTHLWANNTPLQLEMLMLTSKTLSGPGLPAGQTWGYAYETLTASQYELRNVRRKVTVTKPDASQEEHIFGASNLSLRWEEPYPAGSPPQQPNEGLLLSHRILQNGNELRKTENEYQPFPEELATSPSGYDSPYDPWVGTCYCESVPFRQPMKQQKVTQQGETFTYIVEAFDALARPVQVRRFSSLGYSRRDVTTYFDHTGQWVLGQVAQTWNDEEDQILSRTEFDATTAAPVRFYGPGKASGPTATPSVAPQLVQTVTYRADGTVATIKDGRNLVTQTNSWYRGVPRQIVFADGSSLGATVDGAGRVTSVTNELGYATSYAYDAGGRLSQISWPTGDVVAWAPTQISYASVATTEYGLGPGHWRRTESRGNYRKLTYYDAFWRPVVEREYDTADQTGTQRFNRKAYDVGGQVSFEAYPGTTATLTTGLRSFYDALGRPTRSEQDSELGTLVTQYAYLPGFRTRVTNPRGYSTETAFQAFDAPATGAPVEIIAALGQAEQQTTTINKNVLGQTLSLTRSGVYAGVPMALSRHYVYDPQMRLCKRVEPETGAALFDYDAAGNVAWTAEGQALTSLVCDRTAVVTSERALRSYDNRNRQVLVDYPDSTPDVSTTYTANGMVETITRSPTLLTYTYNKRGLLDSERLEYGSINWLTSHSHTTLGHLGATTYPSGLQVAYAPNALGQASQAGTYATGAKYHPNGALAEFTYGNGIVHTMSRNLRQLPERSRSALGANVVLDDSYDYDANGNVAAISDGLAGGPGDRDMSYDALDRLAGVVAGPAQGGNGTFAYDPLDNLRVLDQGSRQFRYHYDADNRLAQIKSPTGALLHSFGYDARGNTTSKDGGTLTFDRENRLTHSALPTATSYVYDGLGRRVREFMGASTYFYYSHEGKLLYTNDLKTSTRTDHIYLSGSLVAARKVPFAGGSGEVTYQHTDALGTPVAFTDAAGNVTRRERMTAWGEPADGTWSNGPGYTGHQMDAASKLVYMQQRYYDPAIGRFLSVDPVAARETGDNFNRYNYAANNPYRYVDPDGREIRFFQQGEEEIRAQLAAAKASTPEIRQMIKELEDSPNVHNIGSFDDSPTEVLQAHNTATGPGESDLTGAGTNTYYDPGKSPSHHGVKQSPVEILVHELKHAHMKDKGIMPRQDAPPDPETGNSAREQPAIDMQNEYRRSQGEETMIEEYN